MLPTDTKYIKACLEEKNPNNPLFDEIPQNLSNILFPLGCLLVP